MNEIQRWRKESRPLEVSFWFNAGLLVFALVAMGFDHRLILGINPWTKPAKFDISVMIFLATMAGVLSGFDGWRRSRALIGWGIAVAMMVENAIISLQALRGVRSHMNMTTPLDAALFGTMGIFIAVSTGMITWLLVLICRNRLRWPRAVSWGVRLGLLALVAGSLEGGAMIAHGAHTVGAADGGAGMPIVNWSRSYGDLRIAHFFALHAMQAMPLLGWALWKSRLAEKLQLILLVAAFAGYMVFVWWLFERAMAGLPVFS